MTRLNEREIISIFQKKLGKKNFTSEDVEVFRFGNTLLISKVDTLVQSTDIPKGMKIQDVARKSIVGCVSDFAAKGVNPKFCILSLTIPKNFTKLQIKSLAEGFSKACKEFKIKIIGGDTNEGKELVINVILFGTKKTIVARKGAKVNDIIITTGPFGYTSLGLKELLSKKKNSGKILNKAKKTIFYPIPKLKFGVANSRFFSSSMDSSDGLAITLHEMAKQSNKQFIITKLPANQDLIKFSKEKGLNYFDLVFYGGEEYEIVATVNPKHISKLRQRARNQKIPLYEIGFVTLGNGVLYKSKSNTNQIKNKGWLHFES